MGRSEGKGRVGDAKDRTESLVGCLTVQAKVDIGVSLFPPPTPPLLLPFSLTPLLSSSLHSTPTQHQSPIRHFSLLHLPSSSPLPLHSLSPPSAILHFALPHSPPPIRHFIPTPSLLHPLSTPSHFPVTYPSLSLCTRHPSHPTST